MLNGLDTRITPDLMDILMRMGHGDELAVVDANFPAAATAAETVTGQVVELPGLTAPAAIAMILKLMPLDGFHDHGALWMERDGAGSVPDPVHAEALEAISAALPEGAQVRSIERQAYYARARKGFAVVRTTEPRAFGCFILRMGVVF
jgi:L-fucose mutarotase